MKLDPRLRLRHIACFLEIAQSGSVVAAADALAVTQPAVSKTLRELEEILGQRLFDRAGRRLRLNAAGMLFQQAAGAALAELTRAQNAVRRVRLDTVRIAAGVLPTAATDLMPRAAIAFREAHPNCVLRVSTGPNWLLLSQLREGSLDLVVGRMAEADRMAGLSFRQLYQEEVVAVVRPGHPLLAGGGDPRRLQDFPLILPPRGAVIAATVRSWLVSIGLPAEAAAWESVSLAFGRGVVQGSDAVWFISRGVVAEELRRGALVALRLHAPMQAGPLGVSRRAGAPPSAEVDALVATLERVARELAPAG
ncbi:MAG: pca operon transcription factor PcaQ [Rhodobacteraceae bacterium]|nr:pca operon transcription factor PcaQ [Paracoccaceae bacterium]